MPEKLLTDIEYNVAKAYENISAAAKNAGRDPAKIRLMAVTKTVSPDKINEAIHSGCNLLGENRVQELLEKYESYDKNAEIHFIGSLQTNKVKYIVDKVSMIESVSSLKLAEEIEKRCAAINKTMDILLEVNIADEESKSGFAADEVVCASEKISEFPHLRLRGLMTIGRFGAEIEETRQYFQKMRNLLVDIKSKNIDNIYINVLSMGMSADYELAVSEGATIVRIGRGLFGERKYSAQ
ncbi:MAG: YggS family pyridoxal phosphate-dependent enzyme [Oscillospiraceae bacterium]|nr:YggS family pyridoxal phosphate-dependent enzyme [Oscillospiraceae bacterium]MBQ6701277.1 YggS family pyridoxal phosphate-dependent enzyme [Oscillospiraceae bacterium]